MVRVLTWVPQRIRKEFATRGGDTRFLMWISFLLAFTWARLWVLYFGKHSVDWVQMEEVQVGSKVQIFGYHPHHIALGVLLLAVAGWIGLHYAGRQVTRVAAVMYGVGLGLIVDEIGFIVEGITPYRDDFAEVFVLVVFISALMMSSAYFPSFWSTLEGGIKRIYRQHEERKRAPPAPATPAPLAANVDATVLAAPRASAGPLPGPTPVLDSPNAADSPPPEPGR